MNVCSASSSKYGLSVEVKCSADASRLPLEQDAVMERYGRCITLSIAISNSSNHHAICFAIISTYETPNTECSGLPTTFKAFLKYPCGAGDLSDSTEYLACSDKGTETASM